MKDFQRGSGGRERGGFNRAGHSTSRSGRPGRPGGGFKSYGRSRTEERLPSEYGRGEGGARPRPQMHSAVCAKCGQRCEVPFRPISSKPVYCSNCYTRPETNARPTQLSDELDRINRKLDKIMKALNLD
jgi:CxxC-x17-CxxC domain-containing protein